MRAIELDDDNLVDVFDFDLFGLGLIRFDDLIRDTAGVISELTGQVLGSRRWP